jgi:hypothetical protein
MKENTKVGKMFETIASFYDDPAEAMCLLKKANVASRGEAGVLLLLVSERDLYPKRIANKIRRSIDLLELALDESSSVDPTGHGLGAKGWQAEMHYRGSGSF